jgi:hypothetical protein
VVQHGRYVAAHGACGTLRCLERLAEPSHAAVRLGLLLCSISHGAQGYHDHDSKQSGRNAVEVAGVKAIVTTIAEPTGHRGYGMCRTSHFYAAVPLGLLLRSGSHGAWGNHDHDSAVGMPRSGSRGGQGGRDHNSRTDRTPRIRDVRDVLFLRRHTTTSESSVD